MNKDCVRCGKVFETIGETVKVCPLCMKQYRISYGLVKPEGWKRKTSDSAEYQREYRKENKDKFREYEAKRKPRSPDYEREKYERKMKRLHGENWQPRASLSFEEKERRRKSMETYKTALKRGKLTRLPCAECGSLDVQGHYPDYDKPLSVIWLCKQHHKELHNGMM